MSEPHFNAVLTSNKMPTPIQTSLFHKIFPPRQQTEGASPCLLLLHGRGADENDLLGLADYLDERLFIITVRAPFEFQFGGGFTWYDILDVGTPEPKMFEKSYRRLTQFFADLKTGYPIDPSAIFLLGFSMGTIMSYAFTLTNPGSVKGVI